MEDGNLARAEENDDVDGPHAADQGSSLERSAARSLSFLAGTGFGEPTPPGDPLDRATVQFRTCRTACAVSTSRARLSAVAQTLAGLPRVGGR